MKLIRLTLTAHDEDGQEIPSGALEIAIQAKASVPSHGGITYDWVTGSTLRHLPEHPTAFDLADGQRLVVTRIGDV